MSRVGLRQYTLTKHALYLGTFVILMAIFFARDVLTGVAALAGTIYGIVLSTFAGGKAAEWIARKNDGSTIAEQIEAERPKEGGQGADH